MTRFRIMLIIDKVPVKQNRYRQHEFYHLLNNLVDKNLYLSCQMLPYQILECQSNDLIWVYQQLLYFKRSFEWAKISIDEIINF